MQDQLTGNTGAVQQQQGDLQKNSPNLQQSGTPTSTANTSGVLSEAPPSGNLQVTTTTAASPSKIQPDTVPHGTSHIWLLLLIVPVIIIAAIAWPKSTVEPLFEDGPVAPEEVPPVVQPKPANKPKKKSTKRKKSGRR